MFVQQKDTKDLLKKYACFGQGKRYEKDLEPLSAADFTKLCDSIIIPSLKAVVIEAGNPCPLSLRKLVGELSLQSPMCGIAQIAGNGLVFQTLHGAFQRYVCDWWTQKWKS